MFFSLLINFFVTMYIFLSADSKIAYLYGDVIFLFIWLFFIPEIRLSQGYEKIKTG